MSTTTDDNSGRSIGRRLIRGLFITAAVLTLGFLASTSVVMVDETEYVLVERLGELVAVYDRPQDRGLHFKLPWPIDTVRRFDRRVQLFDPPGREIFTRDRKNITVDAYVCWKIAEPDSKTPMDERPVVKFYRSLGSADIAEARLDSRLRSIVGTEVGQVELAELLSVEDSEAGPQNDGPGPLEQLSENVRRQVIKRPDEKQALRERLGIEVVDLRIKRINLPEGNRQAVFDRMRSERRKIADRYRSAGMAESRMIRSQADRQYHEILARARADAERIRGEAQADSIAILNAAHAEDPQFYRFLQMLDTYQKILNEKTTLVLSASSNLLKLLTEGIPDELQDKPPDRPVSPMSP